MWLKLLLIPILAYASLIAVVFFAQGAVLFPAGAVAGARPIPAGGERLEAAAPSGERLRGIHLRPTRPGAERLLLLAFGGNAWNAEDAAAYLAELFPEADVVAFHYRGYRPSEGRPSAAALLADAPPIHDLAVARVEPARTIAVGFSIGGGAAASLASRRSLDGLILVTPFDSLEEVAARRFRWLPARWLLRHRMSPAEDLRGVRAPVALIAAGRDEIIPVARADALRRAVPHVAYARTIAGAGHNDIYADPAFRAAMREALAAVMGGVAQSASSPHVPRVSGAS